MKKSLIIFLSIVFTYHSFAKEFDHDHGLFTKVLRDHVVVSGQSSAVKYAKLKSNPSNLNEYLQNLRKVDEKEFNSWSKDRRLAYLINSYNAYTLKLVIDHYPVESIKDIGGFFSSPWEKEFIPLFGKKVHLDHIEHELIRKNYQDPRVHFALVCASIGCPKLQPFAFVGKKLDSQLKLAAKDFLGDTSRNRAGKDENVFFLSSIFKWYGEDFGNALDVKRYVAKRMKLSLPEKEIKDAKIEYLDYDWKLNDAKGDK